MESNFETLEKIPTELMTEIHSDNIKIEDITSNTTTGLSDNFGPSLSGSSPVGSGGQTTSGPFGENPNSQQIKASNLITSDMAVAFLDVVIPVVFVLLFKRIHNQTISKKSISLSNSEKETIKPVLQNYLNSINFKVDEPINALIMTLAFIYGMKYIEVTNSVPSGNFNSSAPPSQIGQPTAQGTIKRDGRGRPKGTYKKPKQVI